MAKTALSNFCEKTLVFSFKFQSLNKVSIFKKYFQKMKNVVWFRLGTIVVELNLQMERL